MIEPAVNHNSQPKKNNSGHVKTFGEKLSDSVTSVVGSWRFIVTQSVILLLWIIANIYFISQPWDPYPFILLNLALSFQAAFTAPIIMMSQNRQSEQDRRKAESDYHVNIKAEKEVRLLHEKIDLLREKEIAELIKIISELEKKLDIKK